jgi:cadmium resistance protein CadD (predicted permease)
VMMEAYVMNRLVLLFALMKSASVTLGSAASKFLGSPMLILVALIVINVIAFAYHKFRK